MLAALAIGTVMMAVMPFAQSSGLRPSDAEMIAHWRTQRPVLEQIARMILEDAKLKRIGKDWIDPNEGNAGLSPERVARYRRLMAEARILVATHYGTQVELVYYTQGMYIRGSGKSFCFGPPPEFAEQTEGDLNEVRDKAPRESLRGGFAFQRHIEGEWWLQYDGT